MKLTEKDVEYVAKLARLKLSPEETKLYTSQFERILEYMDELNKVDTSKVEPTSHALGLKNVFREDQVEPFDPKPLLDNAPAKEAGFFKVQKIIE